MKQTGAVIAAAGLSSRMEILNPALWKRMCCQAWRRSACANQHVSTLLNGYRVAGERAKTAVKGYGYYIYPKSAVCFYEMLDSLKLGFEAIRDNAARLLVMPVDVPAVTEETVKKIVDADSPIVGQMPDGVDIR